VFTVGFSGYLVFFTGTKKPPAPVTPAASPAPSVSVAGIEIPGAAIPQNGTQASEARPVTGKLNVRWERDPFLLPKVAVEKEQAEVPKVIPKLVAILESRNGRVAIIGNEIVSKGDMVGGERVYDIQNDRVVLIRNGSKRVISVEEKARGEYKKKLSAEE